MKLSLCLLLVLVSCIQLKGQTTLFKGLIGCYSFTGNADDKSSSDNHGTVNGASLATDRFGNENSAYHFDGSDYISLAPDLLKNPSYSYAVWAKVLQNPNEGSSGIVFSIGDEFDSKHQTINVSKTFASDGFIGWNVGGYNDGFPTTTSLQSKVMPEIGVWYHLAMTRDNSQMTMYLNGELFTVGSTNGNDPYYGTSTRAHLGIRCNFTLPFIGAIDDFVIYNRVITDQEVKELFNNGIPCSEINAEDVRRCGPGSVSIMASGAQDFRWYDENDVFVFQGNPFITPVLTEPTLFYVAGLVGATETQKKTVKVTTGPPVDFELTSSEETEPGVPEKFIIEIESGLSPFTITWNFDPVESTTSETEISYSFPEFGEHEISVLVKDQNGCVDSVKKVIHVRHRPHCASVIGCGLQAVNLTATEGSVFRWYDDQQGGDLLFEGNPYHHLVTNNTTRIYVAAVNDRAESERQEVWVISHPVPIIQCSFDDEFPLFRENVMAVSVTSGTAPFSYKWAMGSDEEITTDVPSISFSTEVLKTFDVQAEVTDANQCVAECSKLISTSTELFIPNIITPSGDGKNEIFGLFYKVGSNYFLYEGSDDFSLQVFNRWGKQVFQSNDPQHGWSGGKMSSGVYFYLIQVDQKKFNGWVELVN
jgi:gliding motility-associated-like protein